MADNLRVVQFPEAGDGVTLVFRNVDIRAVSDHFGAKYQEIVITGLLGMSVEVLDECLKNGAKKDGKPVKISFDDLDDVPIADVQDKVLNAFSLCLFGRPYLDQMRWVEEEARKMVEQGKENPPQSPEASSAS